MWDILVKQQVSGLSSFVPSLFVSVRTGLGKGGEVF